MVKLEKIEAFATLISLRAKLISKKAQTEEITARYTTAAQNSARDKGRNRAERSRRFSASAIRENAPLPRANMT